jgi:hypothetical protein
MVDFCCPLAGRNCHLGVCVLASMSVRIWPTAVSCNRYAQRVVRAVLTDDTQPERPPALSHINGCFRTRRALAPRGQLVKRVGMGGGQ